MPAHDVKLRLHLKALMSDLTPKQRSDLRARAHHMQASILIGSAGLTDAVITEIGKNLATHDLVKIRMLMDDREVRNQAMIDVCAALSAAPVQHIGKMLVIYRPLSDEQQAAPKKAARRRKQPRRTKRSFQG